MDELKLSEKSFEISKWEIWRAWEKVKANRGAPGVDGCSIEEFGKDLRSNLYRIWNRMSSGSYFPPPVRAVEIPKPHGNGTRILGVPTVADRIAQTVVAARLEKQVEPKFHQDSFGYRPNWSALDAVAKCRERCFKRDWVVDLDIQKFFASEPFPVAVWGEAWRHAEAVEMIRQGGGTPVEESVRPKIDFTEVPCVQSCQLYRRASYRGVHCRVLERSPRW